MEKKDIKKYICNMHTEVIEAMKIINTNASGIVYITDNEEKLVGSLTDGDIRRWIIDGGSISSSVNELMNHNPKTVYAADKTDAKKIMVSAYINSIAVIDRDNRIVDILFDNFDDRNIDHISDSLKITPIIIMAGGKGTRLLPYTKILPKPLIPIGDIPILERILDSFSNYGANLFYISVGYKKEMIKAYLSENARSYLINYIEEDKPLGTAGSLGLIKKTFDTPIIVTNCDILVCADYGDMIRQHIESRNDLTIIAAEKEVVIPYGVLCSDYNDDVKSIEEKPSVQYHVNTGMYIVSPNLLRMIPRDRFYDMTDFISDLIKRGKKVGKYLIPEDAFMDMGQFEEMKKMEIKISGF